MSKHQMEWAADARGMRFGIAVARFNGEITAKLLAGAQSALRDCGAAEPDCVVVEVPGSFELPLASKALAQTGSFDAVIAIGAVIRGDTAHFDFVAGQAAAGLQQAALETGVPVAFGVITTENQEQAEDRAGGKLGNKGYDAAMTAIEMAHLMRKLKALS
jgi:6,7-dimethyl-8-ribityllumazine synthase